MQVPLPLLATMLERLPVLMSLLEPGPQPVRWPLESSQ